MSEDKRNQRTIKDVADIFGISKSSIRYWDSKGLITQGRNKDNDYRLYTESNISEIQDLLMYRNLQIPLAEIKKIFYSEPEYEAGVLKASRENIVEQIEKLQGVLRLLDMKLEGHGEMERLAQSPYSFCERSSFRAVAFEFDNEYMAMYARNPVEYRMIGVARSPYREMTSLVTVPEDYSGDIVWECTGGTETTDGWRFMEFLIDLDYAGIDCHQMSADVEKIKAMGYETGEAVLEYITSGTDQQGRRRDYYKVIMQVR